MTAGSAGYVAPASLAPLFDPPPLPPETLYGRLTAWNAGTRESTVDVLGAPRRNLAVFDHVAASLAAPCTVVLMPVGTTHIIAGRVRRATPTTT